MCNYVDNHHEDDKDDGSHDNYHRSILCITNCHDVYHRSILCITNAAEAEIMMIIRIMMIRMMTVMTSIITASSAVPMVPNAAVEMYRRKS